MLRELERLAKAVEEAEPDELAKAMEALQVATGGFYRAAFSQGWGWEIQYRPSWPSFYGAPGEFTDLLVKCKVYCDHSIKDLNLTSSELERLLTEEPPPRRFCNDCPWKNGCPPEDCPYPPPRPKREAKPCND